MLVGWYWNLIGHLVLVYNLDKFKKFSWRNLFNILNVHSVVIQQSSGEYLFGNHIQVINPLGLRKNCRHFSENFFKQIFLDENQCLIKMSLKFVPKDPMNKKLVLVQIMVW